MGEVSKNVILDNCAFTSQRISLFNENTGELKQRNNKHSLLQNTNKAILSAISIMGPKIHPNFGGKGCKTELKSWRLQSWFWTTFFEEV